MTIRIFHIPRFWEGGCGSWKMCCSVCCFCCLECVIGWMCGKFSQCGMFCFCVVCIVVGVVFTVCVSCVVFVISVVLVCCSFVTKVVCSTVCLFVVVWLLFGCWLMVLLCCLLFVLFCLLDMSLFCCYVVRLAFVRTVVFCCFCLVLIYILDMMMGKISVRICSLFISHANGWLISCKCIRSLVNDKTWFTVDVCFVVVVFALVSFGRSVYCCSSGG